MMSNSENLKIISIAKKHQNRIFLYKEKTSKLELNNETNHIISISNNILMTLYNVITYLSNENILGGIENIPSSLLVACWSSISGAYYCIAKGNIVNNDIQNSWINFNQFLSSKSSIPFNENNHFYEETDNILKENENFFTKYNNLEKAINQLKQEK
ncbi:hypothetical protein BCR36DRAFT_367614 [Piromyces finnis]|uniref:Uncharacterized protein n=1 Tax=Piromyces finnis TaxID=1754191 RepID=A0A1Y1VHZ3_9FUNG|nr:hypothetical protein BCR36DRAFT_367614 [Piromyces finnis]|eukprot:ORX56643.1 hypothetical protein BCR36DRAFT_367614 [Piromyces finnis]